MEQPETITMGRNTQRLLVKYVEMNCQAETAVGFSVILTYRYSTAIVLGATVREYVDNRVS